MKKREWLLLILVLQMGQLILINFTNSNASDQSLLSHISLAGTLISIILAVLAIFIAFMQSESQSRSSSSIAFQIASLEGVVKDINSSKVDISEEVSKISEVISQLDEISTGIKVSHTGIQTLQQTMDEFKHEAEKQSKKPSEFPSPSAQVSNKENEIIRLAKSTFQAGLISYASILLENRNIGKFDLLWEYVAHPSGKAEFDLRTKQGKEDTLPELVKDSYLRHLSVFDICEAFGVCKIEDGGIKVHPDVKQLLPLFESIAASEPGDNETVTATFAGVKKKIHDLTNN